jgi:hypothetical protein
MEKQKAKYSYGILENNSEVYSKKASASKELLVKFYLGLIRSIRVFFTRRGARQLVSIDTLPEW